MVPCMSSSGTGSSNSAADSVSSVIRFHNDSSVTWLRPYGLAERSVP